MQVTFFTVVLIIICLFIFRRITRKVIDTAENVMDKGTNIVNDGLSLAEEYTTVMVASQLIELRKQSTEIAEQLKNTTSANELRNLF